MLSKTKTGRHNVTIGMMLCFGIATACTGSSPQAMQPAMQPSAAPTQQPHNQGNTGYQPNQTGNSNTAGNWPNSNATTTPTSGAATNPLYPNNGGTSVPPNATVTPVPQFLPRPPTAQEFNVTVDHGYSPDQLNLTAGVPTKINFYRTDVGGCGSSVVIPDYNINQELPSGQTTSVQFTPTNAGTFSFTCGMGMYQGSIVVSQH